MSQRNIQALLDALSAYGQKNPGQWVIPGWDGDSISRAIDQAQTQAATATTSASEPAIETVNLVGIKNGIETNLGKVAMPPKMKLKEISRSYFGGDPEDDTSDAALMVGAGMEFFDWLQKQGYQVSKPVVAGAPARLTRQEWDDVYSAFVGAFDTPLARRQIDNEFAQDARRRLSAMNELIVATQQADSVEAQPAGNVLLAYRLVPTTRRLTFDIRWQAQKVTYMGDDDGPYFTFTASNGYQVISRSRMDIQTERIWLLGAKHKEESRSGSMVFSSNEKRDAAEKQFVKALDEWAAAHGGVTHRVGATSADSLGIAPMESEGVH